jgi:hypothetical protein
MFRTLLLTALAAGLVAAPSLAQQPAAAPEPAPKTSADVAAIAVKLAPSLVRVEITPQYDKGESPGEDRYAAWRSYTSQANDDIGTGGWESWEQLVREERPGEHGGFLISPTRVYSDDPDLHPRFIKSVNVRFGDQVVAAKPVAWPKVGAGIILELASPLTGATPLTFDPTKAGPYYGASYDKRDASWVTRIGGLRSGVAVTADGRKFVPGPGGLLVTDKEGSPVTIADTGDFPVDGSWKKAPSDWSYVGDKEMADALAKLEADTGRHLLRVTLNFRSPRNAGDGAGMGRYNYARSEETDITEWNGLGVVVDENTALILANIKPKITGRLERIRLFTSTGEEIKATFSGTLKDWGAFLVKLDKPVSGAATFSSDPITDQRDKLLLEASVTVRGETRTAYFMPSRIDSFYTSWKGETFPQADAGSGSYSRYGGGSEYSNFLYGFDGSLIAVPLERREKVTAREQYSPYGGNDHTYMTPVALLSQVIHQEGAKALDAENRPLTEAEENRLAWLGVEMQGMDPDLARANNVMDETNGGASGGIVTYIYPNSPATDAGLKDGDIILRLHVDGHPKPLEVNVEDTPGFGMMDQFWAALDRVPEEYLDRLPRPWGNVESTLTRALTDLGFGTPFVADVWRDGKLVKVPMKVTQGPAHYDAASRYKSDVAGLTVRDLTYEVRRYLQLKDDEPGVIISKVERGSKASVAGIKPFETIRTINDQPVNNVKDFERLISQGGELKIAVKRMTQGRTVKIKLDGKTEVKTGADDETVPNNP